ncbi:MAG: polymerase, beta-like protein region protein [Candidatus Amesbacteria bacterium GW2011_GWA2_42_12]|uniref:Polymerase, beta-like protein region protein n=1 Tax=Candidatus Amesbacteria bacterium GW2011_GWA2_42_12 TaxID=1618356 RepID=A0A0G0Y721_9BACT|nr:MAG: polymerase, beta-like protein region protein [Candidatus Amesbacteria bacterium GW2011_GWA2_42_12]
MTDPVAISKKFINELTTAGIPVTKVYLYGSYAKGNAKSYSDIDICIISPNLGKDLVDEMVKLRQISRRVDDRIEALPFGIDDIDNPYDPLAAEIRRFGTQINFSH